MLITNENAAVFINLHDFVPFLALTWFVIEYWLRNCKIVRVIGVHVDLSTVSELSIFKLSYQRMIEPFTVIINKLCNKYCYEHSISIQ